MKESIETLLNKINEISIGYDKKIAETGENFNIFSILKVDTSEVGTHSAFMCELLNPKGTHGYGNLFLLNFIERIQNKFTDSEFFQNYINEINTENCVVESESHIGFLSEDKAEGGRIDILVHDAEGKAIVIENKILAGDQYMQLVRYHKRYPKAPILYLTLNGGKPGVDSKGTLKENVDYICISYRNDILGWLQSCGEKVKNHPILRETIIQYINLIKKLTGQTMNEEKKNGIVELLIACGNHIESSIAISDSVYDAKLNLLKRFAESLEKRVREMKKTVKTNVEENFGCKYCGIHFKFSDKDKEYLVFSFLSDISDSYFEIANENNNKDPKLKNKENLQFYKDKLNPSEKKWGRIEKNIDYAWWGDWVCRYREFDKNLYDPKFWAKLADNKSDEIVNQVAYGIVEILNVLEEKLVKN